MSAGKMALSQLTIIGAGLIGGSVALAARERQLAKTIVAIDKAEKPHKNAGDLFDRWVHASDEESARQTLATSDLAVLCVPVAAIIGMLPEVLDATPGLVTDCGSTKTAITQSIAAHPATLRFVAGHPMAGHPVGGLENARGNLFEDRTWLLCPTPEQGQTIDPLRTFIQGLGAKIIELSAEAHDDSVAITSHVPQVVASTLAVFADKTDALSAAGPGFASATRVAGGAEAMWRDIFSTNGSSSGSAST